MEFRRRFLNGSANACPDVPFSEVLKDTYWVDDDDLADIIEKDARARLTCGLTVALSRYIEALPELLKYPISLDAAIEFSLRSSMDHGARNDQAADELLSVYPELQTAIIRAAELDAALLSTRSLVTPRRAVPPLAMPQPFGQAMHDGVARYELRQVLGNGAQGTVYLALDRLLSELDKPVWVAIKLLQNVEEEDESDVLYFFLEEAKRARRIQHSNVVQVLDCGVDDASRPFLVYAAIEGKSLQEVLPSQYDEKIVRRAVKLMAMASAGVQAAHQERVVHGDIKPSNIIVDRHDVAHIIDFGIATCQHNIRSVEQIQRATIGFAAPEQLKLSDLLPSAHVDIYSLGGTLYYLLTGQIPNDGSIASIDGIDQDKWAACDPVKLCKEHKHIDITLARIIARAMSWNPAQRHQSADALATDLNDWLESRPIRWQKPSFFERARLFVRRQPVAAVLLFILGFVVIAGSVAIDTAVMRGKEALLEERLVSTNKLIGAQKHLIQQQTRDMSMVQSAAAGIYSSFSRHQNIDEDWLPMLAITESIVDSAMGSVASHDTGHDEKNPLAQLWLDRLTIAKKIVSDYEAKGHGDDYQSLLWQDAIAFWSIRAGDYFTARKMLNKTEESWKKLLPPQDLWWKFRRAMSLCCAIQDLYDNKAVEHLPSAVELRNEAVPLLNKADAFKLPKAMVRLLAAHVVRLYKDKLINDPQTLDELLRQYFPQDVVKH